MTHEETFEKQREIVARLVEVEDEITKWETKKRELYKELRHSVPRA